MAANTHSTTHNGNTLRTTLNLINLPISKTERSTMDNFIGFNPTYQLVSSSQPNISTCKPLTTTYEVGEVKWSCSVVSDSATPWTVARQAPLSMGFSRQEYWSGLPFPSPGDLPNPGIEPGSPALQADALSFETPRKPRKEKRKAKEKRKNIPTWMQSSKERMVGGLFWR